MNKKLTLKSTMKLFNRMQKKLSDIEFDEFVDKFWSQYSSTKNAQSILVIAL